MVLPKSKAGLATQKGPHPPDLVWVGTSPKYKTQERGKASGGEGPPPQFCSVCSRGALRSPQCLQGTLATLDIVLIPGPLRAGALSDSCHPRALHVVGKWVSVMITVCKEDQQCHHPW